MFMRKKPTLDVIARVDNFFGVAITNLPPEKASQRKYLALNNITNTKCLAAHLKLTHSFM
jgi:hypothetical protein